VQPVPGLHASSVHTLPSLQFGAGPPAQLPPLHVSPVVHAFPSVHDAVLFTCVQPVPGLHASSVHGFPSPQPSAGPPTQLPPLQVSFVVQALPSLQGSVFAACVQPVAGLQPSVVHTLPSLHVSAVPAVHVPL
jgi:hypothetical protein